MSFELVNLGDFVPVMTQEVNGGIQVVFRFENGYGASVINHRYSYGTELGVARFEDDSNTFALDYNTPITDDVIAHIQDAEELIGLLARIRDLPACVIEA